MKQLQFTDHRIVENAVPLHADIFAVVSLKDTGPTILLAFTAHQTLPFTGWNRTSWNRCGFCELQ
jgi:hypothetical protein